MTVEDDFIEDFAKFLYRLNKRLCSEDGLIDRKEFRTYLKENATKVLRTEQKMNQLEPGRVYIQYYQGQSESIRILAAPRNPSYINDRVTLSREAGASAYKFTRITVCMAGGIEAIVNWPIELVIPLEEYQVQKNYTNKTYTLRIFNGYDVVPLTIEKMSLMYEGSDGYWKWNGWNTNNLEVWQLPLSVLQPTLPSLNYPEGGF